MGLCIMWNQANKLRVYVRSGYQPCQDRVVRFFGWVWNQTKLFFLSKPGPGPVANTSTSTCRQQNCRDVFCQRIKINGTGVCPTLSVDLVSISTWLSSSISPNPFLPTPVCIGHFGIDVCQWSIAVTATLRGVNAVFSVGWVSHQPSHAFHDVSSPLFDSTLVIVIPFHILQRV